MQTPDMPSSSDKTSFLHIEIRQADKAGWVKATQLRAKNDPKASAKLADWVIDTLNAAAAKAIQP